MPPAKASMILWGMGVSQHVHGTDNVRCLIALASITGQIGRPGTGLHPLRGQNNVQGASDAGLIPMMYPNYQRVTDPAAHDWFEEFWGMQLDAGARLHRGRDHGQDPRPRGRPAQDPRHVHHGREPRHERPQPEPRAPCAGQSGAPRGAGHLPDRDRFPCRRGAARQRLAREDRHRQQHRPHGAVGPPGPEPARRRARRPVDHPADRPAHRAGLGL